MKVRLAGSGFGQGVDVDFSKIMIGNARVLETDLAMYDQQINLSTQVNYETAATHGTWARDVVSWTDSQIVFHVPLHASRGPLVVQVQKRLPGNDSLLTSIRSWAPRSPCGSLRRPTRGAQARRAR